LYDREGRDSRREEASKGKRVLKIDFEVDKKVIEKEREQHPKVEEST
jgi:hypothetical protein